jgi:hypothetical protein
VISLGRRADCLCKSERLLRTPPLTLKATLQNRQTFGDAYVLLQTIHQKQRPNLEKQVVKIKGKSNLY